LFSRFALTVLLAVVVAACSGSDSAEPDGESPQNGVSAAITIAGFSFGDPIEVVAGTTVTVTNDDSAAHTWTSSDDTWPSAALGGGESFDFTFEEAGTYEFFCSIHPTMTGSVTVTG